MGTARGIEAANICFAVVKRQNGAAIYPFELCRAILRGFRNQMIADDKLKPGSVGLNCMMRDGIECCGTSEVLAFGNASGEVLKVKIENTDEFKDDLTGQILPAEHLRAARRKEMNYVRSKGL